MLLNNFFSEEVISRANRNNNLISRPKGYVKIYDGITNETLFETKNMIVQGYRNASTHLLAGINNNRITQFKISTGNTPPDFYDTNLEVSAVSDEGAYVINKPTMLNGTDFVLSSVDPNSIAVNSIKFIWRIEPEEGNYGSSKTYREAGMFCGDGSMFCRVVFDDIIKTSARLIIFEWSITYE